MHVAEKRANLLAVLQQLTGAALLAIALHSDATV